MGWVAKDRVMVGDARSPIGRCVRPLICGILHIVGGVRRQGTQCATAAEPWQKASLICNGTITCQRYTEENVYRPHHHGDPPGDNQARWIGLARDAKRCRSGAA